ncbi:MAG: amidohydrolase, partial [Kovacikia sp.]
LSLLPYTDPLGSLILGRPTQVVNSAWINGQRVIANGKLLTADIDQLRQELFDRSRSPNSPKFQIIHQIEAHYRKMMGLAEG